MALRNINRRADCRAWMAVRPPGRPPLPLTLHLGSRLSVFPLFMPGRLSDPFPPQSGVMGVLDSCRARGLRHRGGGRAQRSGGAAAGDGCCHVLHPPEFPFVFGVLGRARPHRRADLIRCRASHLALGVEHHRPGGVVVTTLADRGVGRLMASDGGARRPSRSRWALVRRRTRPPMAPAAAVTGVALAQVSLHPRQFRVTTPALPEPIRGRTHRGGEAGPAGIVRFPGCQIKPSSWGPTQVAAR